MGCDNFDAEFSIRTCLKIVSRTAYLVAHERILRICHVCVSQSVDPLSLKSLDIETERFAYRIPQLQLCSRNLLKMGKSYIAFYCSESDWVITEDSTCIYLSVDLIKLKSLDIETELFATETHNTYFVLIIYWKLDNSLAFYCSY